MASYYRDLKAILEAAGCYFVRAGKGSHEIWYSPINGCHFTVVYDCPVKHTANKSLKDAGLEKAF